MEKHLWFYRSDLSDPPQINDMEEERIENIYIRVYFWVFLVFETLMVIYWPEPDAKKGLADAAFSCLSLVPLFGYAHHRRIGVKALWLLFLPAFFAWQVIYFSYMKASPGIDDRYVFTTILMLLILRAPLFWSVVNYTFITMAPDGGRAAAMAAKRDALKKKARSIIVLCGALALLMLMVCLFILIRYVIFSGPQYIY